MKNPLRVWRTGTVAVVMAALGCAGAAAARSAGEERPFVRRQSPYGVAETVLRIEASARRHGMAVFVRFEPQERPFGDADRGGSLRVLVLESSLGGTPVVMGQAAAQMELPLSVTVRQAGEGSAEVLLGADPQWDAMAPSLASDLLALNEVVGDALDARGDA